MNIERAAADSLLAGLALLGFVASLALLNAVSVTLAHLSWVVVTLGGAVLTATGAGLASRAAAHAGSASPRLDPRLVAVTVDERRRPHGAR